MLSDTALESAPSGVHRLFDPAELATLLHEAPNDALARLLEEGDTDDLRWLFSTVDESAVADWLAESAGRRLSRRSRLFWCTAFGLKETAEPPPLTAELWLL